jgi:CBS domain-containing protein
MKGKSKGSAACVSKIMTADVASCGPDDMLSRAAQIMWERDCGFVPVVASGMVVGTITDRDACMAAYTRGEPLAAIRVGDVMSRDVETCTADEALKTVEQRMQQRQIRRMPVVDGGKRIIGVVSLNDLALAAARARGEESGPSMVEVGSTLAAISNHREPASAE